MRAASQEHPCRFTSPMPHRPFVFVAVWLVVHPIFAMYILWNDTLCKYFLVLHGSYERSSSSSSLHYILNNEVTMFKTSPSASKITLKPRARPASPSIINIVKHIVGLRNTVHGRRDVALTRGGTCANSIAQRAGGGTCANPSREEPIPATMHEGH